MAQNIKLISSGISFIDQNWGGFYSGGTYLVFGPRKSGRTSMGLQFSWQGAMQNEVCVYFTSMRPRNIIIQAESMGMDIQTYIDKNLIVMVRTALPYVQARDNADEHLAAFMRDTLNVVEAFNPDRLVFDELTPYVDFEDLNGLENTFLETTEILEENNITSLYLLSEPATPRAQSILERLLKNVTGHISFQKTDNENGVDPRSAKITITPNIGHNKGRLVADYALPPNRQMTMHSNLKHASNL